MVFSNKTKGVVPVSYNYYDSLHLSSRREHAQSKEQLESFIAEVDQISGDVDPSLLLTQRQKQQQV